MWRASGKGSFNGNSGRYVKKGSEYRNLPLQGPLYVQGEPGIRRGARILGTLNDKWRALGTGHLSPMGLRNGDLEGGLLYWRP
jgi:hypothetical protein